MIRPCAVIPVYNHQAAVTAVVSGVLAQQLACIVVDDGSTPACAAVLDGLAAATPSQVTLLRHRANRGKGAAVLTGIRHAAQGGFTHVLQIDADGQHQQGVDDRRDQLQPLGEQQHVALDEAVGRDAADVSFLTVFGSAEMLRQQVEVVQI